ncbi:MAG: zinc-ribbon domain-containing protein [Planctomycetes bacterium]|nr:zinc-ribbon domain-containing protein [Planctomycetota bacterium]
MNCPKCGSQNTDDAKLCTSCGSELMQPPEPAETVNVKTSRLAIASLVFGILTIFVFPVFLLPGFNSFVWPIIVIVAVILAIILGIIALVRIGLSAGRVTGKAFAAIGIGIPVVLFFSIIFLAALLYKPPIAYRVVCGSKLLGLGRAMFIYANDYDNQFPSAGGTGTIWQPKINNWQADNRSDAFGLKPDGTGGSATISSSLYLLVKYAETTPKSFVCPSDRKTKQFKVSDYTPLMEDEDAWDFGPEPAKHYSYSYHMPYSPYALKHSSDPNLAVAADRNPWLDPYTDTTGFKWDNQTKTGGRENIKGYQKGNSGHHKREGQNVLFMDIHVNFEKQSFCGVNDDNIYTYWDGPDIQRGAPPVIGSQPADKLDSLLVNDPPLDNSK